MGLLDLGLLFRAAATFVALSLFIVVRAIIILPYFRRPDNQFYRPSSKVSSFLPSSSPSKTADSSSSPARLSSATSPVTSPSSLVPPRRTIPTLVVLGSGGHTTEMLKLVSQLNPLIYTPIHYCYASTDTTSLSKLKSFEPLPPNKSTTFHPLPRPREVGQSYVSSIVPTLLTVLHSLRLYLSLRPELLLVNGPSTALPLVYVSFLHRLLVGWLPRLPGSRPAPGETTKVVFVESFARVNTLSLTGKLAYPVADEFVVHWEELARKFRKARYEGRII